MSEDRPEKPAGREAACVYGPVPSRRLGRSLGVDLVPFKTCTYDCIYCQLGRTTQRTLDRREHLPTDRILDELGAHLAAGPAPDYIGLAGSGEPTLHLRLGELIDRIKTLTPVPVAVLTNGSLLWLPDVREALREADLVLPSLDAGDAEAFQRVNRPHPGLAFEQVVDGLVEFTRTFRGQVWLEVLLLAGITGTPGQTARIDAHLRRIRPSRIQLNTVTRPPAQPDALAVAAPELARLAAALGAEVIAEECPPEEVGAAGEPAGDEAILDLLRRRPCTVRGVAGGLGLPTLIAVKRLEALQRRGAVVEVRAGGQVFFRAARPA